jgi:hypothetical protein
VLIPLLSLLLLTTSAGSAPAGANRNPLLPASRTACALVSRAGVQQALGRTVEPGVETTSGSGESVCEFASRGGQVSIALHRFSAKPDPEAELTSLRKALPGAIVRRMENPGKDSEAWVLCLGDAGVQIHMMHSDLDYVMVSVLGLGDAGLVAGSAQAIAGQALVALRAAR